jgi:hypothetical protein
MQIPSEFKLGRKKYSVALVSNLPKRVKGRVYPTQGMIQLSAAYSGVAAETFWHEVTHAILHDMGDTRWKDEKFVTEFSRRVYQVIKTAEVT